VASLREFPGDLGCHRIEVLQQEQSQARSTRTFHALSVVTPRRVDNQVVTDDGGSPILLVHGFPETWWAFRTVIPILAREHRVYAVDLRGFGDSGNAGGDYSSATSAEDLHQLIGHLGVGPVHLAGQDISGGVVYRLAANHPEDLLSLTGVETGLAGFGAEMLADVTHGGAWYIGALVTPGIPDLLFAGREQEFIAGSLYPSYGVVSPAVTTADTAEFVRTYARPGGFRGAVGLYQSMLADGEACSSTPAASTRSQNPCPVDAGFRVGRDVAGDAYG
jgi:pimeloyl-ACP methyl ester carboxylesterase